jgi:hypothetical protein
MEPDASWNSQYDHEMIHQETGAVMKKLALIPTAPSLDRRRDNEYGPSVMG